MASSQRRERVVSLSRQARLKFWIELFRGVMQKPPDTETHGYTELNFAAFAMLGRRFCPRIKDIDPCTHQFESFYLLA
jgi:hypothetical protein